MSGDKGFFLDTMQKHQPLEVSVTSVSLPSPPPLPVLRDLTGFVSGFFGGLADTLINFPPYGLHLRYQGNECIDPRKNRAIYRPRELYRGMLAYSVIIPITCIADGFSEYLKRHFQMSPFAATFISGMTAALFVSAPTSNVIVYQQQHQLKTRQAFSHIIRKHGPYKLTTGMSLYMVREGIYSTSVFSAKPWLQKQDARFENDVVASILVGVLATVLSQPWDTIATYMVSAQQRLSPLEAVRRMNKGLEHDGSVGSGGMKRFYRGFFLRGYAVVAGIYVMSKVSDTVKRSMCE